MAFTTSLTQILVFVLSTSAEFVNINEVGQKNVRVDGQVIQVSKNVGFIMCARKCAALTSCHGVNFHKQNLTCVLLTDQVITTRPGEGWWYVNNTDWLKQSNATEQSQAQCAASESSVKLSSGAQHCVKSIPKDCAGHDTSLQDPDGVYVISPHRNSTFGIYCEYDSSGGPWTVIQRRVDFTVDFFRSWNDYKAGFGNLKGSFWLGNDNLHSLLSGGHYLLRVDLEDFEGNKTYAEYSTFNVAAEDEKYKLTIQGYNGTAGDALQYHDGMKFSTKYYDMDESITKDCANLFEGGWWFRDCGFSCLNGNTSIFWIQDNLKTASMKVKEKKL